MLTMVPHGLVMRHLSARKKKKLEPYPHPNKWKRFFDKVIYVAAILGPLLTLPQVTKLWVTRDASSLALSTWVTWLVLAFVWLTYGILHKERPIIAVNIGWILVHTSIVVGIMLYA